MCFLEHPQTCASGPGFSVHFPAGTVGCAAVLCSRRRLSAEEMLVI